ncbi:unnamed protein product [Heterobilharzia americana]|nr:unnamed protein product [Heterobilharzia americana]CAH8541246.1 unnamed protein product [Heterobilharzia americana]
MSTYKQEMPPPGGYAPLDFARKMPKNYIHGFLVIGGLYTSTYFGFKIQRYRKAKRDAITREDQENRIALTPFILAEQQRLYLKQIRKNREYEEVLMKGVPDWKVGHWYDYPVFHNPRGLWCDPYQIELYAHASGWEREKRVNVRDSYP